MPAEPWGVENLSVSLSGRKVLDHVTLPLAPGRITAVVGGDGAGKTTLCRVLVGLLTADSGRVKVPAEIGYQPARSGTWGDLTVTENLRFVADAHHLSSSEFSKRLETLLDATGLSDAIDRLAANLSGGMRQKLGVAMALLPQPRLLVLDEPTTGVDPVSRAELWRLISASAADGGAVMLTTTYLDEAERSGAILALDDGTPIAHGSLSEIMEAAQGSVWATVNKPSSPHRWRRGVGWRIWTADSHPPNQASPVEPDLSDLLTAAVVSRGTGDSG